MPNEITTSTLSGPTSPAGPVNPAAKVSDISTDKSKGTQSPAGEQQAVDKVVSSLNEMVQNLHRNLQFSVDEESGDTIIKVVDSETNEVVRQIPSEEIVRLRQRMRDAAGGLFQGAV